MLYPSTAVADRYQPSCYNNQAKTWILRGDDADTIARRCSALPKHSYDCFVGLGRDFSPWMRQEKEAELAALCERQEGSGAIGCIEGSAHALVDFTGTPETAYALCNRLSARNQKQCFNLTNTYLGTMFGNTSEEIRTLCISAAAGASMCQAHDGMAKDDPLWRIIKTCWRFLNSLWN